MTAVVEPAAPARPDPADAPSPSTPVAGFRDALHQLRPYRRGLLVALVIGLAATGIGALQPLLVSSIADNFTGSLPVRSIILVLALLVTGSALQGVQELLLQRAGERYAFDTRTALIHHVYALPIGVLDRRDRADLVSRMTTDVSQTRAILTSGLVEMVTNMVTVVASIVMMALIDWILLALATLALVIVVVVVYLIGLRTRPAGLRSQNAVGELAGAVSRALGSIRTIRATVATRREAAAAVDRASEALSAGLVTARLRAGVQTFAGVAVQLLLVSVIAVGALQVAAGTLTVGRLSAFIMYLVLMLAPIATFASGISMLGEAFGALSRIMEVQALEPEPDVQEPGAAPRPYPSAGENPVFELDAVSFAYPDKEHAPALRKVSLSIPAGTTTAVVGPSGAGKSTLFALLERFYDVDEGTIRSYGEDVRRVSREKLRSGVAYVEQDAPALSGTVRDNLRLAAPAATDAACAEVLRQVNLPATADFLDTSVGENGTLLSGGERQRLAIARALLADSPVLLLDEVTSNLDSNNEKVVQEVIAANRGRQSIVVIAHRLSTVVAADSIVVLEDGRVAAQGTHRELMESSPLYRELAHNQLLD